MGSDIGGKKLKKRVLFIASSGGHLSELLALRPMFSHYESFLMTERTKSSEVLTKEFQSRIGFLIFGTTTHPFSYPFKLLGNCFISLYLFFVLFSCSEFCRRSKTCYQINKSIRENRKLDY